MNTNHNIIMTSQHFHSRCNNENHDSNTFVPSNSFFKNKLSLQTCISSVSIEDKSLNKPKYRQQKKQFMKFLTTYSRSKDKAKKTQIFTNSLEQMKILFNEIKPNSFLNTQHHIEIPQQFIQLKNEEYVAIFNYFCWVWLHTMGYGTQSNKQKMINRLRLSLDNYQLPYGVEFYEKMGKGFISNSQRFQLIIQTCLNGQQYLYNQICTILTKLNNNYSHQENTNNFPRHKDIHNF